MHRIRTIQAAIGMAWLGAVMAIETLRTAAAARSGCSRQLVLAFAIMLVGTSAPVRAQTAGPRLLFTDIESGPKTGGQSNLGAFISIYGEGFGASQGSSTVTIGGQPVASVTSWGQDNAARGLDRIIVQPGPGATTGNIVVTVAGQASNGLPFTVRAGNIYFVNQATGSNGNPGTYTQPWATIWRPRQTMVAGDIVYVIGGTFSQMDPDVPGWDTLLFLDTSLGASGTASSPIAYLGYPDNPPLLQNAVARRGIYLNQDSGPLSYIVIGNMRFGLMSEAILVIGVGQRIVGNDLSNGGEGDKIGVFGDTSAIKILGNRMDSNGTPASKFYSIYVQGFGINRDIEVGWNEVRNQQGGRSMQVYGHLAGDIVDNLRIHDNVLVGSELNNLILGGSDGGTEILGTVTVTGNIIASSQSTEGLRVNDPQGTVIIENNTLYGNAVAQIYLEEAGAGRITLRNNIIVAQAGQQYYEFDAGSSSSSFVPANNLVFGAGPCEAWDAGCINQDPLFAGASDYHLQSGSPAIDRGVATSVSRDHDGIPRPQGAAFDIGAYEYYNYVPVCRVSCSATVPESAGVDDPISFQATATLVDCSGGTVSYSWDFGDGTTSTDQSPTYSYAAGDSYPWSLTATAPGAVPCGQSGTIFATVEDLLALAITKAGTGNGTITSSPAGIDCGADCWESYIHGTPVTLTATPDSGSTFAEWRDACSVAGPCTLTMDGTKTATAIFIKPLIVGVSTLEGEVGVPYHVSLGISGGLPPYTVGEGKGALPAGLSLNSEGIIGTPTRAGSSSFTVQVTDDLGSSVSKKVRMRVLKAVSIATKNLGKGRVGKKYRAILKATGGKEPYAWSLVSGSFPEGLSLDPSTGKITGTPMESGSFNLTLQVTDALGGTASKGISLNIN